MSMNATGINRVQSSIFNRVDISIDTTQWLENLILTTLVQGNWQINDVKLQWIQYHLCTFYYFSFNLNYIKHIMCGITSLRAGPSCLQLPVIKVSFLCRVGVSFYFTVILLEENYLKTNSQKKIDRYVKIALPSTVQRTNLAIFLKKKKQKPKQLETLEP